MPEVLEIITYHVQKFAGIFGHNDFSKFLQSSTHGGMLCKFRDNVMLIFMKVKLKNNYFS